MIDRIPIRWRLTLPFALAMAVVLTASGTFVYLRISHQLLSAVDTNLREQLSEVAANARHGRNLVDADATEGPTVAAVQLPSGPVLAATPSTLRPFVLRAGSTRSRIFTTEPSGLSGHWRVIEAPSTLANRRVVLVVARSLTARDETLDRLAREFLIAGPAALLFALLAGYGLAAAALRPVEAMRRRAAVVSAQEPGRRLPVPPARDELHALALTLNEMLARLERAFEHERRFLSDASHELRTPLALLRAELELALKRPRTNAELSETIRAAVADTERLTRLAEDLLLIARADQGALPVRRERLHADDVLERVRSRFALRAQALERPLRLGDTPSAAFDGDAMRLEQALGNLVDNALEHGAGPVTLSAHVGERVVELHVADEGPGVSPEFATRAFDRFSRADDARSGTGTGLGLSIVALIAQAHGGDAHLESRNGSGTDAWIAVPTG